MKFKLTLFSMCMLNAAAAMAAGDASNTQTHAVATPSVQATQPSSTATPEFIYKYLLGEVAGQRGELGLSGHLFLDLAKSTREPRLAERAARIAAFSQQRQQTLEAVQLWASLEPDSTEAQNAATQILLASGNHEEAMQYLKKLLAKPDTRANGFLYLNAMLAKLEDKHVVLNMVSELATPYPTLPEAQFAIAHAAWGAQAFDLAHSQIEVIGKLRPDWEPPILLKGQLLKEQPEDAIAYYRQFLAKYRNAGDVRLALAKLLVSQKRFAEAKPEFTKLEKNPHATPEITMMIGLLAIETQDYPNAEKYLGSALQKGYKDPDQIYIQLGHTAEKQHDAVKALSWFDKVPASSERFLESRFAAAQVISRTQGVDAAIAMLDEIDNLSPQEQQSVIMAESMLLSQAKRNEESFDLMDKAIKHMPNTPELIYDYAMAAERAGKLDVMEAELNRLITIKPDYAAAYNALGYSYADRNIKLQEAKSLIEKALELAPDDHYMLDSLGWVYYRLGDLQAAETYLQRAYSIQKDPEIAAHLGEVLWVQGRTDEARKTWQSALKIYPDNETLIATTQRLTRTQ